MSTLALDDLVSGETYVVNVKRVLVAGFTGRDQDQVAKHVAELAAMGVPVPASFPTLYRLGPEMARQAPVLVVNGSNTSGEVEPVIVHTGGRLVLTVGSDHTDRDLERIDIAASKAACPKVVANRCVALTSVNRWDDIELRSVISQGIYQEGSLRYLRSLDSILEHLGQKEGITLSDGDVLFLGTVGVKGGIRPSPFFSATLTIPGLDDAITLAYQVVDISSTARSPLAKPELEFFNVDWVGWSSIDGVLGQWERILAADPATGMATRMLRFDPGTDTSNLGVLRHDYWEEVFILSGDLRDLTLDRVFDSGMYACRPPGMPHGPWRTEAGCVTFEVRYPAI